MSKPHLGGRSHRHELIELAALFGTAAVADLFSDLLGHRSEGPGLLACLSALLVLALFVHRIVIRHNTSPPSPIARTDDTSPGTLWRIRTGVEDTPGRLAVLAGALAAAGANILTMQVHPTDNGATDEFLVRTSSGTTAAKLTAALAAAGGGAPWVGRADVRALADAPAHALTLAGELLVASAPEERLPFVLAELLGAARADWREAAAEGIDGAVLQLRVPGRGTLLVTRPDLPFTPAEYARARAMADLAAQAQAQAAATGAAACGSTRSSSSLSEASCAPRV